MRFPAIAGIVSCLSAGNTVPYAPAVRKYAVSAKNADTAFFVPQDLYEFVFNFSWFRLAVANASYIGSKKSCEVLI